MGGRRWEKPGLALVGRALLSKSLTQFSADGWSCTPSLLVIWPRWASPGVCGLYGWVNNSLQEGLCQGGPSRTAATSDSMPVVSCCQPVHPQKAFWDSRVVLVPSPGALLLLSSGSWCVEDCVCALQDWSLCFLHSYGSPKIKSCWPPRSDSLGIPSPFVRSPGWKPWCGAQSLHKWENLFGITVLQFLGCLPGRYGICFYCDCTPPSAMALFLDVGYCFLVRSSILLLKAGSCWTAGCNFGALPRGDECTSSYSTILNWNPRLLF